MNNTPNIQDSAYTFENPEEFTYSFFLENYDYFMDLFGDDAHPEVALGKFSYEFIEQDESLLTPEIKAQFKDEWLEQLDGEMDESSTFQEILDEMDCFSEDLADWFIANNATCLENWKPCLFNWITEMWSTYAINEAIKGIENKK